MQITVGFLEDLIHAAKEGRAEEVENMILVQGDGYVRGRDGLPVPGKERKER